MSARYERDLHSDSGDWTWIGQIGDTPGQGRVVLTFGIFAVYGSISLPGSAPMVLTTRDGAAWVIQADPARVAIAAARPAARRLDFLIPPVAAAPVIASAAASIERSVAAADEVSPPSAVIDLVVGITGNAQDAMLTQLNQMIAVANDIMSQSMTNSQPRVVHTMQVSYPADLSSQTVLERMSGTTDVGVGVDPAFDRLRVARESHGVDLVVLLRDGVGASDDCGAGWLIAAGDSGCGYSVVNAACANISLLHQVAHNLGAQHDREHALVDGVAVSGAFSDSFGYRFSLGGAQDGSFLAAEAEGNPGIAIEPGHAFVTAGDYSPKPGAELIWTRAARQGESSPSMGHDTRGAGGRRDIGYTPYRADWKVVTTR